MSAPTSTDRESEIWKVFRETDSVSETCRRTGAHARTVRRVRDKYRGAPVASRVVPDRAAFLPDPAPEAGGPGIPDAVAYSYEPFVIATNGTGKVSRGRR